MKTFRKTFLKIMQSKYWKESVVVQRDNVFVFDPIDQV